mgnify:CR=1 FL=1
MSSLQICAMQSYMGYEKERTKETIRTWCGHWESHFELYSKTDHTKISYVNLSYDIKLPLMRHGLHNGQKLLNTWEDLLMYLRNSFSNLLLRLK